MSRRSKIFGLAFIALVTGLVVFLVSGLKEESYHGRTLTGWLQQYSDAPLDQVQSRAAAEEAVRTIGAERALRDLELLAETKDGPIRSWLKQKNEKWNLRILKMRDADNSQLLGIAGFEILGTNCAAAVPRLSRLMQDPSRSFTALRCLVGIGAPAELPVCQALTNPSPAIRAFAASQLSFVTDDIEVYLSRLKGPLSDPDGSVRFAAVQALGLQAQYPEESLPLLVKAIHDPQQSVSGYAIKFLGDLGTNGVKAFGPLSNLVENGNAYVAALSLKSLVLIAPARALPMTLAWLQSPDPQRRARGVSILGAFGVCSTEMVQALKSAAKDPDSNVRGNAIESLRKYRDKEKERNGSALLAMTGEPSDGGKTLGEWLKWPTGRNEIPADSQNAIREMGTNAIPALLARLVYTDEKFGLPDDEVSLPALGAIFLLGDKAVPALPRLEELINGKDERVAYFAFNGACNMGSSSVPVMLGGLTNRHAEIRSQAAEMFAGESMQAYPEATKKALPEITNLLYDSDEFVRMNATNTLKEISLRSVTKAGMK